MMSAKIMLLGDIGVGKTSLAHRFVFNKFDSDYKTTIGVDIFTHDVSLGPDYANDTLRCVLWDTDGDFGGRIFETVYLIGASAAIIVADASRPGTLAKMSALAVGFEERFPGRPIARIVNKIDLAPEPKALAVDGAALASAKTGEGVAELFLDMAQALWRRNHL